MTADGARLIGVQIYTRHGARTAVFLTPGFEEVDWYSDAMISDVPKAQLPFTICDLQGQALDKSTFDSIMNVKHEYKPRSIWRHGMLTTKGISETFEYGKWLRQRYVEKYKLISAECNPHQVYCRVSKFKRNVLTARTIFAGLFKDGSLSCPSVLHEYPLKIHLSTLPVDAFELNRNACTRIKDFVNSAGENKTLISEELREKATKEFGDKAMSIETKRDGQKRKIIFPLYFFRDELTCRRHHDIQMSNETKEILDWMNKACPEEFKTNILIGARDVKPWSTVHYRSRKSIRLRLADAINFDKRQNISKTRFQLIVS